MRNSFIVIAAVLIAASAYGQSDTIASGYGGFLGLGVTSSAVATPNGIPGFAACSPIGGNGSSFGPHAALFYQTSLTGPFGVQARLGYRSVSFGIDAVGPMGNVLQAGVPVSSTSDTRSDLSAGIIYLEPRLQYKASAGITLSIGPQFGLMLHRTFSQRESILQPSNITFSNGSTVRNEVTGSLDSANSFLANIGLGASYDIPFGERMSLVPELTYYAGLTNALQGTGNSWKMNDVVVGLSLRYHIGGEPPQPVNVPKPPPEPMLALSVTADGKPVTSISVKTQVVTEVFPLLPIVFFENGSSEISPRFAPKASLNTFVEDSLRSDPLSIGRNVLNIIGNRLKRRPQSNITLIGYADKATEGASCVLATQRAEAVKQYFVQRWSVGDNQVHIATHAGNCEPPDANRSSEPGFAEGRRVAIESGDEEILAGIARTYCVTRSVDPPTLTFTSIVQNIDVSSWSINVVQGSGSSLLTHTENGPLPREFPMAVDSSLLGRFTNEPLHATLMVNSDRATATDIPVRHDTLDQEIRRMTLTLFDLKQDQLPESARLRIQNFLVGIAPGAEIRITGFTDDLGDFTMNKDLSARRAATAQAIVARAAKISAPTAVIRESTGIGSSRFIPGLSSFQSPEERFMSRSVQIEVMQPRK